MFHPIFRIAIILLLLVGCQRLLQHVIEPSNTTISTETVSADAEQIIGRVVRVIDGDTVVVLDGSNQQHRIRLAQIDAPETKQAYSMASKKALSDLIANKEVTVKVDGNDRYQRIIGEIFIDDKNVNLYLVKIGLAWAYTTYVTNDEYFKAQKLAQKKKLGLWADPHAVAPWDYRRQQRKAK